jgi:hypothetical protein
MIKKQPNKLAFDNIIELIKNIKDYGKDYIFFAHIKSKIWKALKNYKSK